MKNPCAKCDMATKYSKGITGKRHWYLCKANAQQCEKHLQVVNFDEELDCNYCYIHCYRCDTDIFHHNGNARKVLEQWNKRISEENE